MEINKIIARIDPKASYSPGEIHRMGFFPWVKTHRSVYKLVLTDMKGENFLKTTTVSPNKRTRYFIKGSDLISFLQKTVHKTS